MPDEQEITNARRTYKEKPLLDKLKIRAEVMKRRARKWLINKFGFRAKVTSLNEIGGSDQATQAQTGAAAPPSERRSTPPSVSGSVGQHDIAASNVPPAISPEHRGGSPRPLSPSSSVASTVPDFPKPPTKVTELRTPYNNGPKNRESAILGDFHIGPSEPNATGVRTVEDRSDAHGI